MEYRKIQDQKVSFLGYGGSRWPKLANLEVDQEESKRLFNVAYENGVNYYDTAYIYYHGLSEKVLGDWLVTIARETVNIATKFPVFKMENESDITRMFNEQLVRLQTDYIDFYLLHSLDKEAWQTVKKYDLFTVFSEYKKTKQIRYLGFSFHDDYELFAEIIEAYPWDFAQIQFNYMDKNFQAGVKGIELANKLNIPLIIMEPLKGGLLGELPDEEKSFFTNPNYSPASMGMRWVAQYPGIAVILSGMGSEEMLLENIATLSNPIPLNEEEKIQVDKIASSLANKVLVPCTGCAYCMPCEFDVDIPKCFDYLNIGNRYNNYPKAKALYKEHVNTKAASNCQKCNACISKCTQHIDIPKELELVVETFEK